MLYFPGKNDYERHKERVAREEAPGVRHFFGKPESYPCIGIEETVMGEGEGAFVYLVDFAYPRVGAKGRQFGGGGFSPTVSPPPVKHEVDVDQ